MGTITKQNLIDVFAPNISIIRAQELIAENIQAAGLTDKETYTIEEVSRICLQLLKEGGLIRKIAQTFMLQMERSMREEAEKAWSQSEERLRILIETIPDAVCFKNVQGQNMIVNKAFTELLGLSKEEIIGKTDEEIMPTDLAPAYLECAKEVLGKNISAFKEIESTDKNGDRVFFELVKVPVHDNNGDISGLIGVTHDITDRKKTEEALRKAHSELDKRVKQRTWELAQATLKLSAEKERLAVTLRSIGDGVITTNIDGNVILLNKVAEDLTGWSHDEAQGKSLQEIFRIVNTKTNTPHADLVKNTVRTGQVTTLDSHTKLISRNGKEYIVADSAAPIKDSNSNIIGVVLVFRDVTEKIKMEDELAKSQKIESIGILAGGIAHDFNNVLTAILNNISLAKMNTKYDDKIFKILTEAENITFKAKDLTQQLLTFSKGGMPIKEVTSVCKMLKDTCTFTLRGSNVKHECSIPEEIWPVEIDPGQITQVIQNLIINADQAMPDGGMIKIVAENIVVDETSNLPLKKGDYIKLSFIDKGVGIPEEHKSKVFDLYFTTKQKGSGLGLSTAYSIIKRHNGHITLNSELGKGTTFYLYLPAAKGVIQHDETKAEKTNVSGKGKILVMDDEELIKKSLGLILKRLGYEVEFASNGLEALELYKNARNCNAPFNVVILDLTIPGNMGGEEVIKKLLKIDPQIKAIASSGYSNDPVMADFKAYGFSGIAIKPYKIEELSALLNKLTK